MRSLVGIACCMSVAGSTWAAQGAALPPDSLVQVRTLTIIASNLPEAERLRTTRALEGRTYRVDELEERVLRNLRDLGYARATVEEPHLSNLVAEPPQARSADISIQVSPGMRYRLEAVIFEGGRSFSAKQMNDAFDVPVGDEFNSTAIGKGLESLRLLYSTDGHINFTAVPMLQFDEVRSIVVLTVSIDECPQFTFGRLLLAGEETRAGEATTLLNAWATLSGKQYDGPLLSKWLVKNAPFLPYGGQTPLQQVEIHLDASTLQADIGLTFPEHHP